ncbi:MAG: CsgG/HfaB family protein, partial [Chloracidobacterium sp.]
GLTLLLSGVMFTSESDAQGRKKAPRRKAPAPAVTPKPDSAPETSAAPAAATPPAEATSAASADTADTDSLPKDTRPRIAIAPIGFGDRVLETALTDNLVNYSRFQVVVARNQLREILGEQKLSNTDFVNPDTAQKVGKLVGANYIVVGRFLGKNLTPGALFMPDQLEIKAQFQLIEVETGTVKVADTFSVTTSGLFKLPEEYALSSLAEELMLQAYRSNAAELVRKFIDKINIINPLKGYVVNVVGPEVYINLSYKDGVRAGQEFMIFADGNTIKDPITGEILSTEKQPIARIVIIGAFEQFSIGFIFATNSPQASVLLGGVKYDPSPVFSVVQSQMSLIEVERRGLALLEDLKKAAKKKNK